VLHDSGRLQRPDPHAGPPGQVGEVEELARTGRRVLPRRVTPSTGRPDRTAQSRRPSATGCGYIDKGLGRAPGCDRRSDAPDGLERASSWRRPSSPTSPGHDHRPRGDLRPGVVIIPTTETRPSRSPPHRYGLRRRLVGDPEHAKAVARRLRTARSRSTRQLQPGAPFGGYKQSGNGREFGSFSWRSSS